MSTRRASRELADANAVLRKSIAEREAAELQVRQMQKMEAVGQLTGGIAHDFNNMLTVIINGIILAQKRIASGADGASQLLANALEGANRASTLVRRLMAFSRLSPLAPEPLDANKFVAGMSELISRALGEAIRMETILGAGLWQTKADPGPARKLHPQSLRQRPRRHAGRRPPHGRDRELPSRRPLLAQPSRACRRGNTC